MIIIQLLLLGAVCATAWYIIKQKEKMILEEKNWASVCEERLSDIKSLYAKEQFKNIELRLQVSDLKKKYGLNKISKKAPEKKLHK